MNNTIFMVIKEHEEVRFLKTFYCCFAFFWRFYVSGFCYRSRPRLGNRLPSDENSDSSNINDRVFCSRSSGEEKANIDKTTSFSASVIEKDIFSATNELWAVHSALFQTPNSARRKNQLTLVERDFLLRFSWPRRKEEKHKRFHTFLHAFLWWLLNHTQTLSQTPLLTHSAWLLSRAWGFFRSACLACERRKTGFYSQHLRVDEISEKYQEYSN